MPFLRLSRARRRFATASSISTRACALRPASWVSRHSIPPWNAWCCATRTAPFLRSKASKCLLSSYAEADIRALRLSPYVGRGVIFAVGSKADIDTTSQKQPSAQVTLKRLGGGVFEIVVDDRVVYSKKATGRF